MTADKILRLTATTVNVKWTEIALVLPRAPRQPRKPPPPCHSRRSRPRHHDRPRRRRHGRPACPRRAGAPQQRHRRDQPPRGRPGRGARLLPPAAVRQHREGRPAAAEAGHVRGEGEALLRSEVLRERGAQADAGGRDEVREGEQRAQRREGDGLLGRAGFGRENVG